MSLRTPLLLAAICVAGLSACGDKPLPAPVGDRVGAALATYEALMQESRNRGVDARTWYLEFRQGDAPTPWSAELARRHGDVQGYSQWPHPKGTSDYEGAVRLAIESLDELGRLGWSAECVLEMGSLNAYGLEVELHWDGQAWAAASINQIWQS